MRSLLPTALSILALAACGGGRIDPGQIDGPRRDGPIVWREGGTASDAPGPQRDTGVRLDLTTKAGDPCTYGACGANLVCMGNTCLKMCTEPISGCNLKTTPCGPDEACMYESDFTGACYPASAALGQACDMSKEIYCVGGTLCVTVGSAAARCLQLCPGGTGCAPGVQCGKTTNNCQVCVQ
jgi:hypothetical protein